MERERKEVPAGGSSQGGRRDGTKGSEDGWPFLSNPSGHPYGH